MSPSPRLLLLAIIGLAVSALPVFVAPILWIAVAGMWSLFALGMIVDAVLLRIARPTLEVNAPKSTGVGDSFFVPFKLHLQRGPLRVTVRSEVDAPLEEGPDTHIVADHGTTEHAIELNAPHRGEGTVYALWSRINGPLGLMRRIDRHEVEAPITVVPNVDRVRKLALAHFGAQPMGGTHIQKRVGDGGELDSLEAYQPGMDLRKVDWKSSARHQQLQVRRFRVEQNQRVVLCADTGRLMADPIDGVERLDHAIHAMLLLSRVALKAGDLVGVHGYDAVPRTWAPPGGGGRQLARIRQAVSRLRAAPEETNHVLGVHSLLSKLKRRSLIVVFTEFTDPTTAELMVEYLAHLARRHLVVFVALEDPDIEEPMRRFPENAVDLASTVVAGELRQARQRVLRRLQRSGVDVVTGPPGPAALRLLNRYVQIKRRGLIG